jgi:uncharacterized lipoprotein YddW (UPF0748 family)
MLLALAGSLVPDLWRDAAKAGLEKSGTIAAFKSFDEARESIAKGQGGAALAESVASATSLHGQAREAFARGEHSKSLDHSSAAREKILQAYCLAQPSLPGEFRAFWCHSAFGVDGMDWDAAVRRLAENGFRAVIPNMLWGGVAYYDSKVLPVAAEVRDKGDQIAQCLAAARKHGLEVHVWKVNWNLGHGVPKEFLERMRREGRLQVSSKGVEEPWLCPSQPANQQLEIDSLLEVVRNYPVDGIHFDYIRYPDADHCFCARCRERLQASLGVALDRWPEDALDGALRSRWLDWRRSNITAVVQAVSTRAREIRPGVKISAAVFPNWTTDRDGVGQDWKLWCEKGYLDFVCPMDYTPSHRRFRQMVEQQVAWAGKVPCYPGIGPSATSPSLGVDGVIEQIKITRELGAAGFTIFNYGRSEAEHLLPMLGLGVTARAPASN